MNKKEKKPPTALKKTPSSLAAAPASAPSNESKPFDLHESVSADEVGASFFSPALFQSMKMTFAIQNTTTNTEVKDTSDIQVVEIMDRGLSLQLPARSCSRGHHLMIGVVLEIPGKGEVEFAFTAKVEEIEPLEFGGGARAMLALVQFDETEWMALCELFNARQGEIENFLKAARGY